MRKTLFSLALAMAVLSSCSSDDIVNNPMNEENHSFPASRSLHENILSFSRVRRNTMPCSIPWARCPMRNFCNGNPDRKASPPCTGCTAKPWDRY